MNISLRDFFAAMAMQGKISESCAWFDGKDQSEMEQDAEYCYLIADFMLNARNVKNEL